MKVRPGDIMVSRYNGMRREVLSDEDTAGSPWPYMKGCIRYRSLDIGNVEGYLYKWEFGNHTVNGESVEGYDE